jgi:hypothetical protein
LKEAAESGDIHVACENEFDRVGAMLWEIRLAAHPHEILRLNDAGADTENLKAHRICHRRSYWIAITELDAHHNSRGGVLIRKLVPGIASKLKAGFLKRDC